MDEVEAIYREINGTSDIVVDANCGNCDKPMRVVTDGSAEILCPACEEWEKGGLDDYEPYVPYREKWGIPWEDSVFPNEY